LKRSIAVATLAACLAAAPLHAFQHETTDDPDCDEGPGFDCQHNGTPLFWNTFPVRFLINGDGAGLGFTTVRNAVSAAFDTWQGASNDGIVFEFGGQSGKRSDGRDGCNMVSWTDLGNDAADTFAQSILTFDRNAGELFDVDTEMNSSFEFAVLPAGEDDPFDPLVDVQAVTMHEVGHLLGLAHENDFGPQVVMFFSDTSGNTTHRALSADDRSGVRAIYPARATLGTGTSTECLQSSGGDGGGGGGGGGCALSPSRPASGLWPVGAVLLWLALRRNRSLPLRIRVLGRSCFAGTPPPRPFRPRP
jgi:hypothetical protein